MCIRVPGESHDHSSRIGTLQFPVSAFRFWRIHARPEDGRGRDTPFDSGFALELSDDVWKDVNLGRKRKRGHKPLKLRASLFVLQTWSKVRRISPNSRYIRRSLLVKT